MIDDSQQESGEGGVVGGVQGVGLLDSVTTSSVGWWSSSRCTNFKHMYCQQNTKQFNMKPTASTAPLPQLSGKVSYVFVSCSI